MIKITNNLLTIVSIFLMSILFAGNLNAQKPHSDLKKTPTPIVIDGELDEIWSFIEPNDIENRIKDVENVDYAYWKACWDDEGIYIVVFVDDDNYWPSELSGTETHQSDKPELYFDLNEVLEDGKGGGAGVENGHIQFAPTFIGAKEGIVQYGDGLAEVCQYAHKVSGDSYVFEYFIPFSYLAISPGFDKTRTLGFDVTVIDRDEVENVRKKITWANKETVASSYNNMDDCGTILLVDDIIDTKTRLTMNKANNLKVNVINETLYLDGIEGSVSVYDINGKSVLKNKITSKGLKISALKNGVYFVKSGVYSAKFIKM